MNQKKENNMKVDIKLISISILIPLAIIAVAKLVPTNLVTWGFLILILGLYTWSICQISKITSIKKELKDLNQEIQEKINLSMSDEEKFEIINNIIQQDKYSHIDDIFNDYKRTFRKINVQTSSGEEKRKYYSTVDIEYFFNEENLIYKNIYYKTINYITQGMTGIGIFGTFMGIVQGIGGLDTSSSEAMKEGINILLGGVSVSFNSSLYGILFSILLTAILKLLIESTMQLCNKTTNMINNIVPNSNDKEGFKELEDELKKQTSSLEKLATDLAIQMEDKFNSAMEKNLSKLTQDLGIFIDKMGNGFSQSMIDSTSRNIDVLNSTISPVIEKLDTTMRNIEKSQQNSSMKFIEDAMSTMKETIKVGTNDEIEKLKESMEIISSKNAEMVDTFTSSMENMKKLTVHQENLIKNTTDSTNSMNMTTENMKELQSSLSTVIESLRNVSSANNISLENVQTTVKSLEVSMAKQVDIIKSVENMVEKSNSLAKVQDEYIDKFNSISTAMDDSLDNTQKHIKAITHTFNMYKEQFESIKNSTVESIKVIDSRYKDIAGDLNYVNNNLAGTIESLDKNLVVKVNDMGNKLHSVLNQLQDQQSKTSALIARIERFSEVEKSTQDLWINYKDSFDNLNSNINEGVENYTKHINNGVNDMLIQYDASIEKTVHSLKTIVEALGETAEEISENLEELNSKYSKVIG